MDFSAWSEDFSGCPGGYCLEATHRSDAEIAWINWRWFEEHGCHAASLGEHRRVNESLLKNFAYVLKEDTCCFKEVPSNCGGYLIDCYGTTSLAKYSGSGRAGVINGLQVKGIGRTPLVATDADWHHSHGYLWLHEAVREAVFSEVCRIEAPCSAVPVIAVIRLDEMVLSPTGEKEQRALLVRPFRVRAAHLQRAILSTHQSHIYDVARVRWHIERLDNLPGGAWAALDKFAASLGRQAAYSHCVGWFNGGLMSSNVTLQGEIIDFGSARYVADRFASDYGDRGQRFGDELETASAVLRSLSFYLEKYSRSSKYSADFGAELMRSYRIELIQCVLWLLGASGFIVEDSVVVACIERSIIESSQARDRSSARMIEEHAVRKCAMWVRKEEGCQPMTSIDRWRRIRYRDQGGREVIEARVRSSLSRDTSSCQLLTDELISGLMTV